MTTRWFPSKGHLKPKDEELRRLKHANERLRRERDILKKQLPSSRSTRIGIRVHKRAPHFVECIGDVPIPEGVSQWILPMAQTQAESTQA
jgi:hypothetical protein